MDTALQVRTLQERIEQLESENAMLRRDFGSVAKGNMVKVPEGIKPLFDVAQEAVSEYFRNLKMDPTQGTIEINDQRYVLVRASALSKDFLDTIQKLYADRGPAEAMTIGKNFLFDIAHVIGMNDAKTFHKRMNFTEPLAKLSAGPVHFAYAGWAFVEILPESNPAPDDTFYLQYNHPYSFEADAWVRSGKKSDTPVCIMNAGYSSGWCEESFGIPLTSVEVSCIAKGDSHCTFVMSPPHKIQEHLEAFNKRASTGYSRSESYEIPTFFERKKVEEEMQRSKQLAEDSVKSKSDFVANMSHELRTPLGAILGFTELLKKTDLDAVQKDYLEAIHSSGNSLLSIINDILDLSKLDAGKFVIETIPFSIPELLHSLEVMFAARAKAKNLHFSSFVDANITTHVLGDPMRLTQILINLIGNAIKFTEKGSVLVRCDVDGDSNSELQLRFSVADTGIGIPEHKKEHIFERFTQADTDITRRYGGTGLGLAITKQLVELQGGSIALKTNHSEGANFEFMLSYGKAATVGYERDENAVFEPMQFDSTKRILIVEDNLMNQKLTEVILQNNGFETALAENGRAAVQILQKETFDLILMDIQMPVMDGYKATCAIRDELHISTPIIAMTAHALDGERDNCIRQGMNDYISKPFREEDLLARMSFWLKKEVHDHDKDPNSVIDLSFLLKQTRHNRRFIVEMINIFKEQTPKDIAQLQKALADKDFEATYKTTHTLRNTIGFFGLNNAVGNDMLTMEKLARAAENITEIEILFQKVQQVFARAVKELEEIDVSTFA